MSFVFLIFVFLCVIILAAAIARYNRFQRANRMARAQAQAQATQSDTTHGNFLPSAGQQAQMHNGAVYPYAYAPAASQPQQVPVMYYTESGTPVVPATVIGTVHPEGTNNSSNSNADSNLPAQYGSPTRASEIYGEATYIRGPPSTETTTSK